MSKFFYAFFCLLVLGNFNAKGQKYFNESKLKEPKKYGPEVKAKFKEEFVYEYKVDQGKHAVFLRNGLRSSKFIAPQLWLNKRDSIYPYRVDIVYSRYPVHDGVYNEIYPLLCNRLIHLFEMDGALNESDLEWRTILQTHIDNDDQVNTLFHGVVIWYRTPDEESALTEKANSPENAPLVQTEIAAQNSLKETTQTIEGLRNSELLNDSVKSILSNKPLDVQKQILKSVFVAQAAKPSTIKLEERTPLEMFQYKRQVAEFLKFNPISDSVVWKVMERHPEWADALVVNDWTGSMYGYGAQVVSWHLLNYKSSGIRYLTLFNDGDGKTNATKVIGETGGIYTTEAGDIPKVLSLFNLVRLNGSGGDRQENNVEAILESIKQFPDHQEIILIADNYACIRDIELATKINKPVRVIICGYIEGFGVNPHLAYLAKITNGGLYTLEEDIENLKVELGGIGEILNVKDKRFSLSILDCRPKPIYQIKYGKESFKTYTSYDTAYLEKLMVRQLDLSGQSLKNVPSDIKKMKNLMELNLSKNDISQVPSQLAKLGNLKNLNLSQNHLTKLPKSFVKLSYLENLDLSDNHLEDLSLFYPNWYYLKKIDLSNNQLESAEGINNLKNLQYANLSFNNFAELPVEIHQLKKLVSLDLSNNRLLYLPKTFSGLTKIEEINLENNQLGSLPPKLYRLRKLKSLNLSGNPLSEKEKERIRAELPNVELTF
ncbi:MAG: leucine-rich repeat domain-containing protein [Bacteroidia bacterium]|nr:leucine-rich repeat domain-containing protein [Bacteroidia bacterium]